MTTSGLILLAFIAFIVIIWRVRYNKPEPPKPWKLDDFEDKIS